MILIVTIRSLRIIQLLNIYHNQNFQTIEEYENYLYDTAKLIYRSYVDRFINKKNVTLPKEEYRIMSAAHTWYLSNRDENKISLPKSLYFLFVLTY